MLTIAYMTMRKEPKIEWFFHSLGNQIHSFGIPFSVVIIDFHAPREIASFCAASGITAFQHGAPKPNVWQGPHRLTKEDYFAAANARNTALCLAPDGWIAFVDDLSVLMPGWLSRVKEAMNGNAIVGGAYKKVNKLVVENGIAVSYEEIPSGVDSRWGFGRSNRVVKINGGQLYGCSFVAPVEALLTINGFPEFADGLGSEDYLAGIVLENVGYEIMYDRQMLTLESEELHHSSAQWEDTESGRVFHSSSFKRTDKGISPNDKSHAALALARRSNRFENYFGPGGIREVRAKVLAGEPFPIQNHPQHDWYDQQPLSEM